MKTIKELINKIMYDKRENPKDYTLLYFDRVTRRKVELKFIDIDRIENGFMIVIKDKGEINIPLHRVREVRKKYKVVWKR
ncbi:DUF504 domain-containing protein [Candidatus Woesearchaeota archaeon]|nr:MAG: DUF504 domain-containing protein [Candidatus Woesearchaeota archaeon]